MTRVSDGSGKFWASHGVRSVPRSVASSGETRESMRVRPVLSCRVPALIASRAIAGPGATVAIVIFHQFLNDDLGCACYLVGDEEAGDRGGRRSAVRDRAAPRGGRAARGADRPHDRDAHARRPCLGSRSARARARHPGQRARRRGSRLSARPDAGRRRDRGRGGRLRGRPHPRPPARALLPHRDRPLARPTSPGSCSPATRSSSAMPRGPTSRSAPPRGPKGSSTRLRRLLELADGVEVFPGHVAGSLCGKSMSSKPSTTIGFERRFNPSLQLTRDRGVHRGLGLRSALRSPQPRPHRGDQPRARSLGRAAARRELAAPPPDAQLLDVRPVGAHSPGTAAGPISVPVSGTSFCDEGGVRARRRQRGLRTRGDRRRGRRAIRGPPLGRASSTSPGSSSAAGTSAPTRSPSTSSRR